MVITGIEVAGAAVVEGVETAVEDVTGLLAVGEGVLQLITNAAHKARTNSTRIHFFI